MTRLIKKSLTAQAPETRENTLARRLDRARSRDIARLYGPRIWL